MNSGIGASCVRRNVVLEALSMQHADNMLRWMRDPEISRNIGLRQAPSIERTRAWIDRAVHDPSVRAYAILHDDRHAGNVVLDRIDGFLGTARLSVYIGEQSARRIGVGSTGMHLALSGAFFKINLHKVWLTVHAGNIAATAAYRKLGFVLEGVLRDEFWMDGRRCDALYMGLLRTEFRSECGEARRSGTE